MHHKGVSQAFFAQNIFCVFRSHNNLFLTRFKRWKESGSNMQVLPGLAVTGSERLNVRLLDTKANKSEPATHSKKEEEQKKNH